MRRIKLITIFALLGLFIMIAPAFADANATSVGNDTNILTADYYFDANVENDTGNGSAENPYKELNSERIPDDSVIHLANGEYVLSGKVKSYSNLSIVGNDPEKTIVKYWDTVGFTSSGLITLKNVTFLSLRVNINSNCNLAAINTIFKDCSASNSIIYSSGFSTVILDNCTLEGNSAQYGGAINLKNSKLNITNSVFSNNHATYSGGAICCDHSEMYISDSKFIDNYVTSDAGGAIYLKDSDLVSDNLEMINCSSVFGGAITSLSSNLYLANSIAKNNKAKYYGGAIYKMYTSFELLNSTFENNSAPYGGALFVDMVPDFKINSNYFVNNNATYAGGAIYCVESDSYYDIIDEHLNNTFENNTADYENDVYQSWYVGFIVKDNDYILMHYNSSYEGSLPEKYDLRDLNLVTPVKNQGSGGNCWSFSALAALESAILKAANASYDLSEENMKNIASLYSEYGWAMETNTGGYDKMAMGYLTSWLGPVNESVDSYRPDSLLSPLFDGFIHVQNIVFLTRKNYTDNDVIKKAIMEYGAVSTSVYWSSSYIKNKKNYYYDGNSGSNHAVAIVGWDDNYSASNFKTTPKGNGAWIIKNSHGSDSGEGGYFYVSYYDARLAQPGRYTTYAFVLNDTIKYDKNYQYDIPGRTDYFLNESNTVWYKAKFNSTDNEYLAAVSTYFQKDTDWDLYVYVNDVLKLKQSGFASPSYKTIDLDSLIPINVGDIFEIVFKITVDKEAGVPISEYVSLNSLIYFENTSFISYDGENWVDFYDLEWNYPDHTYNSQVACIKAFTVLNDIGTNIVLDIVDSFNPVEVTAHVFTQYGSLINSGKVTFNVEGNDFEVNVKDGVAKLYYTFKNLEKNIINATFEGVGYNCSSSSIIANVNEVILIADDLTTFSGDVEYSASVVDENNKPVSNKELIFNVDNMEYSARTNADGLAAVKLNLPSTGNYKIKIGFKDSSINTTILERNIIVKSTITLPTITKYAYNSKYSFSLWDSQGNPLKNKDVNVTVNNVDYVFTPDSDGNVNVNIKLSPGSYIMTINNLETGEVKSQTIKVVARITGNKDLTMYYGAGSSYKVRVYDDYGNIAKNVEVTFTIAGKTYSRYSDSNGYASLKINLNPNTYTITAKYKGYKVSNKIVVKPTLVCKDMTVKKSKVFTYSVKLLNNKGKILKNKIVKVKFRGKTYSAKTNSNGYAKFKLTASPKAGKLTLTAIYGSAKVSKKITVK